MATGQIWIGASNRAFATLQPWFRLGIFQEIWVPEAEYEDAAEIAHEAIREETWGKDAPRWIVWTAVSTMVMALFAAVGALLAGIAANEALLTRSQEIIEVVYRQGDRLMIEVLQSRVDLLTALGQDAEVEKAQILDWAREVERLTEEADKDELEVAQTMRTHEVLAIGLTLLSIAITLSGMAVVSKQARLWHVGLVLGAIGALVVGGGVLRFIVL